MQDQNLAANATENSEAQQKNEQAMIDSTAEPAKAADMKDERERASGDSKGQAEKPTQDSDVQMEDANKAKSESEKPNTEMRDQDGTYIASDLSSISHMIDQKQMMQGFKPVE